MTHEPLIIVVTKNQQLHWTRNTRRQTTKARINNSKEVNNCFPSHIHFSLGETADFMKPTFSSRHTNCDCQGSQFSSVQSPHVASPELLKLEGLMALVLVSKTLPAKKGLKSKSLVHYPANTTKVRPSLISCDFVNSLNFGKVGFF